MKGGKYSKYVMTSSLLHKIPHYTGTSIVAHQGELEANTSFGYHCISKPMSFDEPHSHDFTELLCFIGGNPLDINDLGAEIEFTLGGEKHQINSATIVSIPPNMEHCPIVFKKVDRPLVFLEISATRVWESGVPRKKSPSSKGKRKNVK